MAEIRKYAIFGGSFDPIHIGHVTLARHAVSDCGLDRLIFMPAYVSPFKQDKNVTAGADRCAMIERVLSLDPAFRLSRYELGRPGPSYTIETLRHWKKLLGGELSFVMGLDSVVQVDKWYEGEDILRDYHLITSVRPDTDTSAALEKIAEFRERYGARITVLEKMLPVDASSSEIRRRISEGEPISDLVTEGVEEYILEHDLYR